MIARRRGDRTGDPAARGTTAFRQRGASVAPSAIADKLDPNDTATMIVDLIARLADGQIAGAVEDLHRLPRALHRAVLHEAGTRTDLARAEGEVLFAGEWP